MKKITLILMSILLLINVGFTKEKKPIKPKKNYLQYKISLEVGAGIKKISNDYYDEVYGQNTNIYYNFGVSYKFLKSMEVFLRYELFNAKGELTYTKDETELNINPLEFGLRFIASNSLFMPYIELGGGYYMYNEKNLIGEINEKDFGFFGGLGFRINVHKNIYVFAKGKYVFLKVNPNNQDEDTNLGGLSFGGGIGFRF